MNELGTNKGSEIRNNRDGKSLVRMLTAEISDPTDNQSVELIQLSGEDFKPEDNDIVLVISVTEAYKIGLLIDDQVEPDISIEKGEKLLYSKLNGVKLAKIKLTKDSEVILNDGIDFGVKFNALQARLTALEGQLLAHTHGGVTAGAGATAVSSTVFDLDISTAKAEKVKL